jgi:hypothetical protein
MMTRHGVVGLSPLQLKRVLEEAGVSLTAMSLESCNADDEGAPAHDVNGAEQGEVFRGAQNGLKAERFEQSLLTVSERERRLRQAIQKRYSTIDSIMNWEHGSTNRLVLQEFRKSRETMTLQELTDVWTWLQSSPYRSFPTMRASQQPADSLNSPLEMAARLS